MEAEPPDAFLSYTRFDDRHDGGAISEFCRRLASAVRAATGAPFEIFQDVEGIGVGEHWRGRLDEMLDEARFLIPIVTPSYFNSKPCRDELEKFLRAEAERERNDLVLPIYYIECELLEDDDLRAADPLATMIHERQRQDWRKLRYSSFKTKGVRTALDELAKEIVRARRRPMPAGVTRQPAAKTPGAAGMAGRRPGPQSPHQSSKLTAASPSPGTVFRDVDAPWCPELVVIPPGKFMMGSTEAERRWAVEHDAQWAWVENEQPQHPVEIAYPIAVGRFLVTFEQYDRLARITRRDEPGDEGWGRGRRPVVKVSWEDARAYVDWLCAETSQPYRLLSEAEWEYACRAGTATRYWWGDEITPENANYGGNSGRTSEIGTYRANPWGLYDTHGNVWEWVEDCWNDRYDGAPGDGSAWTSGDCNHRVMRGGSWKNRIWDLRSAKRFKMRATEWVNDFGFRVARTLTS